METYRKGRHWWKTINIDFSHEETTELNFVVRKTIENEFIYEEGMKINSINKNSEKILFDNSENQKNFFHWLKILENEICRWEIQRKNLKFVYKISWEIGFIDSFSVDIVSIGKKSMETTWNDLKPV